MSKASDKRYAEQKQSDWMAGQRTIFREELRYALEELYGNTCFDEHGRKIAMAAEVADIAHEEVDKWLAEMKEAKP